MNTKIQQFLIAILLLTSTSIYSQMDKIATVEGITQYELDNGLKVLLFPDNSAQTVTVNITYLVGSRHEGYGEKGMAHLLEHMVFKGTPNHPDIPKELSSHGARPNGTTWYDRTNYFETVNATDENIEWALDLEADRMVNSHIAKADLESEFTVVRNEFEAGENNPSRVLREKVMNAAYQWHNYGKSTIGNRSDIERVPIDNLKAFYKKYYRPDNAVLMITGKFDEENVLKLVEDKFGKIGKPKTPIRDSYTEEPAQDGEKFVTVSRVGDIQLVSALYHIASGSDPEHAAMAIVENVLTDEPSGRLYKALIETQKASSIWSFSPFTKEPGFMYINVDVPSNKDPEEVQKVLRKVLDSVRNQPITQEELDRAKANLLKDIDEINRNSAYLGTYMSEFIGAGDFRLSFIHRDRIADMTLEEVNIAASKYLIPSNRTVGRFNPTKNPERVAIPIVRSVDSLVSTYKGKEDKGTGEAFDVTYDHIEKRLDRGTLNNDISYGIIEKNNRGKTVNFNFSIRNGDVKSLSDKGMIPSLTASMLNKGTSEKSRQEIEDELSRLKTSIYFSSRNGNVYAYVDTTEENLIPAIKLMAEMLKSPAFVESELTKLKTERLAQLEANKSEPQFLATQRLGEINNSYEKGHPLYNMTIEEQEEAIKAVTIEDIKKFYGEFYGLGKSIMVGIGDISSEKVKSLMEKEFADFKSTKDYAVIRDPYIPTKAVMEDILTPDKKNAMTFGALGVKVSEYDDDYPALNIAGTILGGGFLNSRIAERLRQKDGVSYGAGAGFQADTDEQDANSQFFIYAIYAPMNYDKIQLGFKEEIARFIAEGITEEELKNAVNGWIQGQNVSRAKDNELASLINNNLYYDRSMDFHKALEEKIQNLTVKDVNAAIKKYLQPYNEWTVVNAGDFKK